MDVLNSVWNLVVCGLQDSVVHMWSLFITEKLIDSKLQKQGRDVIKQSVLFAPENKVSCLKQSSKMNRLFWRVKFETIVKCHEWYLCQIPRTNHAIICLYYYPQKVCNFHM